MKTGLNFVTTTIINANKDVDSGKALFSYVSDKKIDGVATPYVHILRDFIFTKDNIVSVRKAVGYEAEMCEVEIDFTALLASLKPSTGVNYCRLDMYIKVVGAEPSYYAIPWVQKGKPFWCEFVVKADDTAEAIATRLEKTIKANHIFQVDKDQFTVTRSTAKLTFKSNVEYLRFSKIEIRTFSETSDTSDVVTGYYANMSSMPTGINVTHKGKNAFGTYSQIIKDLRLPTCENTHWTHIRQAETPVVGAIYDQFIVEYCAPANNRPLDAVGCEVKSYTTHIFWVKNDLSADFMKLFNTDLKLPVTVVSAEGAESETAAPTSDTKGQSELNTQKAVKN